MPPDEQRASEARAEAVLTTKKAAPGTLFAVATPIGNLEDITLRAIRALKEADLIACEDTRRTQALLLRYEIRTRTISYHQHNEMTRAPELVLRMEEGSKIALVSDAGVPVISDPGYRLIKLAIRHNIPVIPVPGPSALMASLSVSGLPLDRFRFAGFLPPKKTARRRRLQALTDSPETLVFYEAPHRVVEMLEDALETLGDRPVAVAREVTKMHEEFLRGRVSGVVARLRQRPSIKGEMTVVMGPLDAATVKPPAPVSSIAKEMKKLMSREKLTERDALKKLARKAGVRKSALYRQWQVEKSISGK